MKLLALALVTLMAMAVPFVACGGSPTSEPTVVTTVETTRIPPPSPTVVTTVVVTEVIATPEVPEPNTIELSGFGQSVTEPFTLGRGLTIFTGSNDGDSNFIADLIIWETGETEGLAMNEIGPVSGVKKTVTVSKTGSYILDVRADGGWTISIEQPNPLP